MAKLNDEQRRAFNIVKMGHNLLILGKVGVGKTHLMRAIVKHLCKTKDIGVTASTGMARLQFHNGETLHHFSGYGDGHLSVNEVIGQIINNVQYKSVKEKIRACEVLIIDEIGLISAKMFESVELICRTVRESELLFGGIQVVGAGSFVQLPPVPSTIDEGKFAFQADIFQHVFPHKLNLKEVVRQRETGFINAINELCDGCLSDASVELLKSLERPLPEGADPVYIFGTNLDVDFFNFDRLSSVPGPETVYKSVDDGLAKYLRRCVAPKHLVLKVNCKVLVTRNLNNGLVNGMTGTVMSLNDSNIVVRVEEDKFLGHKFGGKIFDISKYTFTVRDDSNKVVAVRKQFPVRLGYALTVDKAQGRSIEHLVVDAYNFWRPGQFGVAVGRAVHTRGLQIQNFNEAACQLRHPQEVYEFYNAKSKTIKGDKTCCTVRLGDLHLQRIERLEQLMFQYNCTQATLDGNEGHEGHNAIRAQRKEYPYNVNVLLEKLKIPSSSGDLHTERNGILDMLQVDGKAQKYIDLQYGQLIGMMDHYGSRGRKSKCGWCIMCKHLHTYLCSSKFADHAKELFNTQQLSAVQNQLGTDIVFAIVENVVSTCSHVHIEDMYEELGDNSNEFDIGDIDPETKKTIRYIGGAAVAHVASKLKHEIHRKMLLQCYGDKSAFRAHRIISKLRIPESVALASSSDVASLHETVRRQGMSGGLTHITDAAFQYFCLLYVKLTQWQNTKHLKGDPHNMHQVAMAKLKENVELVSHWMELFQNLEEYNGDTAHDSSEESAWLKVEMEEALILNMFDLVVSYVAKTHLSDILSRCKESLNWKRGKSLRCTVWTSTKNSDSAEKRVEFPCGICAKECIDETDCRTFADYSVLCDQCETWYHLLCAELTGKEVFLQKGSDMPYYCIKCQKDKRVSGAHGQVLHAQGRRKESKRQLSESDNAESVSRMVGNSTGRVRKKPNKLDL